VRAVELKKALVGIADDAKLIFSIAEESGSDLGWPRAGRLSAGASTFYDSHAHQTYPAFEVSLELPPGIYLHQRRWKGDEP
jgi:hypothetical protein